jgi:hypothetical protein
LAAVLISVYLRNAMDPGYFIVAHPLDVNQAYPMQGIK